MEAARWHVKLFGVMSATRGDGTPVRFETRRSALLLAYLLLFPDRPHPRQRLMELLWPDEDPLATRDRFKQTLACLRRELGCDSAEGPIYSDRQSVRLDSPAFETDVRAFERCIEDAARAADSTGRKALQARADVLASDELLAGCCEPWIHQERERLNEARQRIQLEQTNPFALPVPLTRFFGREREIAELSDLIQSSRLVTICGLGGMGKTRLAIETASRVTKFDGGIRFIPLSGLRYPDQVLRLIATSVGIMRPAAQGIEAQIAFALGGSSMLLVLDCFETVLDAGPALHRLLEACPTLTCLVTSRCLLEIKGEVAFAIPPLDSTVELFLALASARNPKLASSEQNLADISEICQTLDGIPLAVEMAAAWCAYLSPRQVRNRLADRFEVLVSRMRDADPRQASMRLVLDETVGMLDADCRQALIDMTIFQGGWTLEAAQATRGRRNALASHSELCNRSLIQTTGSGRFRMLDTVSEYLQGLLESSRERELAVRLAEYFFALAKEAETFFYGPDQAEWLDRLEEDHANIRAALELLEQTDPCRALEMAGALTRFWEVHAHYSEGREVIRRLLELVPSDCSATVRARTLGTIGLLTFRQSDMAAAISYHTRSLELYRELGERTGEANALNNIALAVSGQGDRSRAWEINEQALEIRRQIRDVRGMAQTLNNMGYIAYLQARLDVARTYLEESLQLHEEAQDERGTTLSLMNLGLVAFESGRLEEALAIHRRALEIQRRVGDRIGVSGSLANIGFVASLLGDDEESNRCYRESLRIKREIGDRRGVAATLNDLANLSLRNGCLGAARAQLRESLEIKGAINDRPGLINLAESCAVLASAEGDHEGAARLLGFVESERALIGAPRLPSERTFVQPAIEAACKALGDTQFEEAVSSGKAAHDAGMANVTNLLR